jgi:2,4-dienoyl-CoA reductase-like NADH-dependent reductase (Old Yellow Enzyme family)
MALETYAAIRESTGADFPVLIKINVNDGIENEVMFEDVLYLCDELTKAKIDAVEISGAFGGFPQDAASFFKKEAEQIAARNDAKVILTGGNRDFAEMTEILRATKIEYFGMARPLINNPDLINLFRMEGERRAADVVR